MFFIKISLAKLERIVQFAERTEIRFNTFADAVQPVVTSAGKKTVEAISNIDASEVAEKGNEIIEEASDRAKRWLNKDRE